MTQSTGRTSLPDTLTVIAISVVVAVITDVLHEFVGHGGACLLIGAHPLVVSTVHFECSVESRLLSAGGTIVNLIAGVICWAAARKVQAARLRYFFWLMMVFNLLDAGGYFLYSGIGNIGDWAYVIHDLQPAWLWRVGLTLFGIASYWFFVLISIRELEPLLSPDREQRLRLARRYTFLPYFTNGILLTIAGLFNPVGMILVAISAMAASFGGTSGLLWMGSLLHGNLVPSTATNQAPFQQSWPWIAVATVSAAFFVVVIGRGVKL